MQEQIFKQYGEIINSLIKESILCSPNSWKKGKITIDCDGKAINYKLKNEDDSNKAQLSGEFRDLCEKLYVVMSNNKETWIQATLEYEKNDEDIWDIEANFDYESESKKVAFETKNLSTQDSELAQIVKSFIKNYNDWNTFAVENSKTSTNSENDPTFLLYQKLINKFCPSNKEFQGLAYGGESSHNPENEKIISVIESGNVGVVNTTQTDVRDFKTDYEYHFVKNNDKWLLEEVYYIDCFSGVKYEAL